MTDRLRWGSRNKGKKEKETNYQKDDRRKMEVRKLKPEGCHRDKMEKQSLMFSGVHKRNTHTRFFEHFRSLPFSYIKMKNCASGHCRADYKGPNSMFRGLTESACL